MENQLSRKEREILYRKDEIINVAEMLFAKKGFFNTTMAEIAEKAEFSLGTIYQFFKSKEELYYTIINEKMSDLHKSIKKNIKDFETPVDKLSKLIETVLSFLESQRDFFIIYISERNRSELILKEELSEKCSQKYMDHIEIIEGIIQKGIKNGDFKKVNSLDAAFALAGMMNSLIFQWLPNPNTDILADKGRLIADLFLNGVLKEKDHEC